MADLLRALPLVGLLCGVGEPLAHYVHVQAAAVVAALVLH